MAGERRRGPRCVIEFVTIVVVAVVVSAPLEEEEEEESQLTFYRRRLKLTVGPTDGRPDGRSRRRGLP